MFSAGFDGDYQLNSSRKVSGVLHKSIDIYLGPGEIRSWAFLSINSLVLYGFWIGIVMRWV